MQNTFNRLTGEFANPIQEQAFLVDAWPQTAALLRGVFLVATILMGGLLASTIITEIRIVEEFPWLIGLRSLQVASFCLILYYTSKQQLSPAVAYLVAVAELISILVEVGDFFFAYRPIMVANNLIENLQVAPVMVLLIFLMYTLIPNRFSFTVAVSLFALVMFSYLSLVEIGNTDLFVAIMMLFSFINFVGIAYGRYFNRLRRMEWQSSLQALQAKQEAEAMSEEKSQFIHAIGHDLQQPVNTMRLLIDSFETATSKGQSGNVLAQLERSVETLNQMGNQLLELGTLQAGALTFEVNELPMSDILDSLRTRFTPIADAKNIDLRIIPSSLLVLSDPVLLERIAANLIDNAIKYTDHGRVLVGVRRSAGDVTLSVLDTGRGIVEENREEIFTEYRRLTLEDGSAGIGLGLSIVTQLCDLLEHKLALTSTVRGSHFKVTIAGANPSA